MGSDGNFVRSKMDYCVMFVILAAMIAVGQHLWPEFTSSDDIETFKGWYDPVGLEQYVDTHNPPDVLITLANFAGTTPGKAAVWIQFGTVTSLGMHFMTWAMLVFFRFSDPENTPTAFFWPQFRAIVVNFVLLPIMQTLFDAVFQNNGYTKVTAAGLDPLTMLRDSLLWMLCFEWAWYTQHRAMHDVKFLWVLGHSYHHTYRKPEHMIGITNFAFDHIVEIWVTMSSSFLGFFIFPCNFFTGKLIGLAYMVLAVFAHWEGFRLSRYHINHHYLVTKNYGSHVPIFDLLFGTYEYRAEYGGKTIKKKE